MKMIRPEIRRYSEELKRKVVEEVESGKLSQAEATRQYKLRKGAIWDWIQVYGSIEAKPRIIEVVMSDQKEKIQELQQALAEAHLKLRIYDKMIECANEEYKIDLKKNFGTKASEELKEEKA